MNANPALLEELRVRGELWSAARQTAPHTLDAPAGTLSGLLPSGWPRGALVEVLSAGPGFGEVSLFAGLAAELTCAGREVAWVAPPGIPSAAALSAAGIDPAHLLWVRAAERHDAAWAAHELLGSGAVPLVLMSREPASERALRSLALAAREGDALGVLFGGPARRKHPSPARLRLEIRAAPHGGRRLVALKGRGIAPGTAVGLED